MTETSSNFLTGFTARQVDNLFDTITRYTRFVLFTKGTLVFFVVVIVGLLIIRPIMNKDQGGIRIAFSNIEQGGDALTPKMLNPQFRGFDEQDQPFTVTADYALQKDDNTIQLSNVNADITLNGGKWVSLKSNEALLDLKAKMISATGKVSVFYDDGYEFSTEYLKVDVGKKILFSDHPVSGQGPMGAIEAKGVEATHSNKSIRFKGPIRLTIFAGAKS